MNINKGRKGETKMERKTNSLAINYTTLFDISI